MLHAVTLTYSSHEEDITLYGMHIRNGSLGEYILF